AGAAGTEPPAGRGALCPARRDVGDRHDRSGRCRPPGPELTPRGPAAPGQGRALGAHRAARSRGLPDPPITGTGSPRKWLVEPAELVTVAAGRPVRVRPAVRR